MEQKRTKQISRQQIILLLVCIAMLLAAAACFGAWWWLSHLLASQREAERWQGDSEMPYKQISCFLPMNEMMSLEQIATFRSAAMAKLKESSLDISGDEILMMDCWSTNGTVNARGEHGKGEAAVASSMAIQTSSRMLCCLLICFFLFCSMALPYASLASRTMEPFLMGALLVVMT